MSIPESIPAKAVEITESEIVVELRDGSRHSALISRFPILADATPEERANWRFIGRRSGVHWPDIDEDISVFSIIYPERTISITPDAAADHIRINRQRRDRRVR